MKKSIGIIGLGMVGGALDRYFTPLGYTIYRRDIDKDEGVNNADVVFISVPTPYLDEQKDYDLSAIRESLSVLPEGKLVVLKSTITPGTTDKLQAEFPNLKILFNPEFLTEATTDIDFNQPDRQLIGYTEKSKEYAKEVLELLPVAPYAEIMPASAAEMVKLTSNAFMSMKVVFYNQIYDVCQAHGIDYDQMVKGVIADRRIGPSHSVVWHGGKRGFGGKCLPKDINALIAFAEKNNNPELLKTIRRLNDELRGLGS